VLIVITRFSVDLKQNLLK